MKKQWIVALVAVALGGVFSRSAWAEGEVKESPVVQQKAAAQALPSYAPESPDYQIAPPDVIRVEACGTQGSKGCKLRSKREWTAIAGVDGYVDLKGVGKIWIAGLTRDQASQAMQQHCDDKEIGWSDFSVTVKQANSRVVYVLHRSLRGDFVQRMPLRSPTTPLEMLEQAVWSHPVDLSSCAIELRRPMGPGATEEIIPIAWKPNARGQDSKVELAFMPGDRIVVAGKANE